MKTTPVFLAAVLLLTACKNGKHTMSTHFISKKETRTAIININGSIETVFPLFGAFEERKWATGWNPELIYPAVEIIEEGTTFKTRAHPENEKEYIWRVSKYDPAKYLIQYLVTTENRYWTITVQCDALTKLQTKATITYTYIGLNDPGNKMNEQYIAAMYKSNLHDWEEAINYYLQNGREKVIH